MNDFGPIPQLAPFLPEVDPASTALRWKRWTDRFENLMIALNITDYTRKRALLLHLAGEAVYDTFDGLVVENTTSDSESDENNAYANTKRALDEHFSPKKNVEFEVFNFRLAKQNADESTDTYHARLRTLVRYCEFSDVDAELKSHIIQSCYSSRLRRRALVDPTMTLKVLLDTARAMETSERQSKAIERVLTEDKPEHSTIARVQKQEKIPVYQRNTPMLRTSTQSCRNCGLSYPHPGGKMQCPAWQKTCYACNKLNHFQQQCQSKPVERSQHPWLPRTTYQPQKTASSTRQIRQISEQEQYLTDNEETNEDSAFVLNDQLPHKIPYVNVIVAGISVNMLVDTGASVNIIDEQTFSRFPDHINLYPSRTTIHSYASTTPVRIIGHFEATVKYKQKFVKATFHVAKGGQGSLLSYATASNLGLIELNLNLIQTLPPITIPMLEKEYPQLFYGIGKLKNFSVKLHIDESVIPSAQQHRRIPFHIRTKVEEELNLLLEQGIIERIEGPTPWMSPIVTPVKPKEPDKVRICVDMRQANKAILRERHVTPTLEDIINDLNGAKLFSKLDLKAGYHQLELDENSRYITTFSTHIGLFRYKRLNFGISSASEVFQNTIAQVLDGIPGVMNISDDIIIFGRTTTDHDNSLRTVIHRLMNAGLTLNKNKCELNKKSLTFFGHVFSESGVSMDPDKLEALKHMSSPTNATEVRSLLGMINYNSRFIRDYATKTDPLRELTKTNTPFTWGPAEQRAFEDIKSCMCQNATTAYYDPNKRSYVTVDASPVGLGAILAQEDGYGQTRVVTYVSRSLTEVEQRYSQTEREALACVWACERLHRYIYGSTFDLITDHKPLEAIYGNPRCKLSARMERWSIRLQPYDFRIIHKAGKNNPADYMSRHPDLSHPNNDDRGQKVSEEYLNFIISNAVPKAMTLEQISEATISDVSLQKIFRCIESNNWQEAQASNELHPFYNIRNELCISDDAKILLRGTRIVIPHSLQEKVIQLSHEGHQGITKTKKAIRQKVWFPGIDKAAEDAVKNCLPCQASTPQTFSEPLQMTPLPDGPWQNVSVDFCGPLPTGEYLLVIIDDYSRYPVVEIVTTTSANAVIPAFDRVFAMFGTPMTVKSDNGPPFNSEQFRKFAEYSGFKHRRITPYWPRANGEAERFMRTLKKSLQIANMEKKSWKQEMYTFLRAYRSTPHTTTEKTPAELLLRYPFRGRIPQASTVVSNDNDLRKQDQCAKQKMKAYRDASKHNIQTLEVGDTVLVKKLGGNKLSGWYDDNPLKIINIKGTMITAGTPGYRITRNSTFFKKINSFNQRRVVQEEVDENEDDYIPNQSPTAKPNGAAPPPNQEGNGNAQSRRYPTRTNRRPPRRYSPE